jgi:hypothetical protein
MVVERSDVNVDPVDPEPRPVFARCERGVGAAVHLITRPAWMWQPCVVTQREPTREDLEAMVATLREEVSRLKEEVRRLRRDAHEVPPHYL